MARQNTYFDLKGRELQLEGLDAQERRLLAELQQRAKSHPDWDDFENYWTAAVAAFYDARGLSRQASHETLVYRIAQDLSGRLAITAGMARPPDYRDELEEIIRRSFGTRREFCRETGLSEDMLSHVLAHRKDFAIGTLTQALDRVGYTLRIVPRQADPVLHGIGPVEIEEAPMPTAIDEFPRTDYHFYRMGVEYYIAGRFGALHGLTPVPGNLLHHAVEMVLKGKLAHHYSRADLKNQFRHDLARCWRGFKSIFPTEDLSAHDDVVNTLNEFEDLRYPDDMLKFGAHITIGFVTRSQMGGPPSVVVEPGYMLSVTDLDALMARLFKLCGINPEGYMSEYGGAVEIVERYNIHCQGWFPQREKERES
jgi:hypothetical protein